MTGVKSESDVFYPKFTFPRLTCPGRISTGGFQGFNRRVGRENRKTAKAVPTLPTLPTLSARVRWNRRAAVAGWFA